MEANTLTATDKVHLLKWLLDVSNLRAEFALARPTAHPVLDRDYPARGALRTPLLRVELPEGWAWLDPSCATCQPGAVRPELEGGQVLILPAQADGPVPLKSSPWPASPDSSTSATP